MDKTYWLRRKRAAMAMARAAATAESRLIHYDMAGQYSVRAAHATETQMPAQPCAMAA